MNAPQTRRWKDDREGFALAMVVFLLFAVALAGATGYQIVNAEHEMSTGGEAEEEALFVARAGIERYVGEHIGVPGGTSFSVDSGTATVTVKKIAKVDSASEMWMIQSVGTIADPRYPSSPATRTVRQFARLHLMPVYPLGVLMTVATSVTLASAFTDSILGMRDASYPACTSGSSGWNDNLPNDLKYGIVARNPADPPFGNVDGAVAKRVILTTIQAVKDSAQVNWSTIENTQFPVGALDNVGALPAQATFNALPADSFPIVRVQGNLALGAGTFSGKGALIVTGTLSQSNFSYFSWNGIVLAGSMVGIGGPLSTFRVTGMLVAGLDGSALASQPILANSVIENCTYYIKRANRSLAFFELVDGSRWEF